MAALVESRGTGHALHRPAGHSGEVQRIIENGQPFYLLPAHRNTKRADPLGQQEQFVLRSTSLLDWSLGGHVPPGDAGDIFLHEGQIAVINEQQHLKMVIRTSSGKRDNKSLDGVALNPPARGPAPAPTAAKRGAWPRRSRPWNTVSEAWFGQSRTGTQLYVYNDGPAFSRMAVRYKVKPANGTWSDEQHLLRRWHPQLLSDTNRNGPRRVPRGVGQR